MIELAVIVFWFALTTWVIVRLFGKHHLGIRILAALAVLLLNGVLFKELINSRRFQTFGELMRPEESDQRVVAITLDDGPSRRYTGEILELLDREEVRATFFLIGKEVSENAESARAIVSSGHEIGNHSWSHKRMVGVSLAFVQEEIERTDEAIRAAGYKGPILFRSPYGKKFLTLPWYLARNRRTNVFWDLEPESDPELAENGEALAAYVIENVAPGSIVLLHVMYPAREESRRALPLIIEGLRAKGYRFVTVSELRASSRSSNQARSDVGRHLDGNLVGQHSSQ